MCDECDRRDLIPVAAGGAFACAKIFNRSGKMLLHLRELNRFFPRAFSMFFKIFYSDTSILMSFLTDPLYKSCPNYISHRFDNSAVDCGGEEVRE